MLRYIRALYNPPMFQGWGKSSKYFEGWYYKIVSADQQHALAIIPGIAYPHEGSPHAFIQVMDGKRITSHYHTFSVGDFVADENIFEIAIGDNSFSTNHMSLNLPLLKGTLTLHDTKPLESKLLSPGIMGWYAFAPFMECYHGIVSMRHHLVGTLEHNNALVDFITGVGYIEKDWGRSFPEGWIWMHSNNFKQSDASLMASVAKIPWLGSSFNGFIVAFHYNNKLYRFASYTGAKLVYAKVTDADTVHLAFEDKRMRLEIEAVKGPGSLLVAPHNGHMTGKVNESLQATLHVRFFHQGVEVYNDTATTAGLELGGNYKQLLTEPKL